MYHINNFKYILIFFTFNNISVYSQLIELKNIENKELIRNTNFTLDTIQLPIWEDFSSYESKVGNNIWNASNNVSVNNYSNNFSPSINVLILDGTDENGNSYNHINNFGKADSLCSDIINLDSYQINDKLYLSFYWNYNVNGEFPDYEDSIKLEFYNKNHKWKTVWYKNGGSNNFPGNNFKYEIIQIKEEYLHDKFMFKFYNLGNTEGPFDSWALDYIYLNKNRNINDSTILDRAITYKPKNIFKKYNSIPIKHLSSSHQSLDSIKVEILNFDSQIQPINYSLIAKEITHNIYDTIENKNPLNPILNGFERRLINNKYLNIDKFNINEDSISIELKFFIESGDSIYTNQNLRLNDTSINYFNMSNYYSYDDNGAEYAAGLNQKNSELVLKYNLLKKDTLTHIQILFPQSTNKTYTSGIKLIVYKKLNNEKINLISDNMSLINYGKDFNIYKLETPIIVSDTIFIGYKQFENNLLSVGLDKNNNTSDEIYYYINNQWEQNNLIKGSLMIRPVFGDVENYLTNLNEDDNETISIYPNPSSGIFYINKTVKHIQIIDINGKIINNLKNSKEFNITNQKNGLYLVHIINKEKVIIKKIIKN